MGVIYVPATRRLYWGEAGKGAFTAEVDADTLQPQQAQQLPLPGATQNRPFRVVASRSHLRPKRRNY